MQGVIKGGVGDTPETLVGDTQIQYEVDRPHRGDVRQVSRQLDVSTTLTPTVVHFSGLKLDLTLVVVRKYTCENDHQGHQLRKTSCNHTSSTSTEEKDVNTVMVGICSPTVSAKKVCQRLTDQ